MSAIALARAKANLREQKRVNAELVETLQRIDCVATRASSLTAWWATLRRELALRAIGTVARDAIQRAKGA